MAPRKPPPQPPKGAKYSGGKKVGPLQRNSDVSGAGTGKWTNASGRVVGTSRQEDTRYYPVKPKTSVSKTTRKK